MRTFSKVAYQPVPGLGRVQAVAPVRKDVGGFGVTRVTFQSERSWLKAMAELNMLVIFVTLLVSHAPMGWLKAVARSNMYCIFVTLFVTQPPMGWLKAVAELNMLDISVTVRGGSAT